MLNDDVKIIKTQSGLRNKINYSYDFFSVVDIPFEKRPTITFDATTKTISIPLVAANGKVTNKFIIYNFNGQYFEKVKN
jgi:predicted nucleotidyltransferase component of viral defense system